MKKTAIEGLNLALANIDRPIQCKIYIKYVIEIIENKWNEY